MASPNYTKVSEDVIEEIRQLGMSAALKKAKSGAASAAFVEGVRRFYPGKWDDVKTAVIQKEKGNAPSSSSASSSSKVGSVRRVAERAVSSPVPRAAVGRALKSSVSKVEKRKNQHTYSDTGGSLNEQRITAKKPARKTTGQKNKEAVQHAVGLARGASKAPGAIGRALNNMNSGYEDWRKRQ